MSTTPRQNLAVTSADVVVIGGGANGTSTAHHLAARGVRNVVLLERRHLGAGATGKSGSLVRMHYTNEPETRLACLVTRVISPTELRDLLPGCRVDDVGAAAHEPHSGFADPNATTFAFAEAARRLGVRVETEREARHLVSEEGRIATPVVVLAAGAWAGRLLEPLGLDFGLTPHRLHVSIFRWPPGFARRHPAVIDAVQHSWLRPEGAASTLIGVELGVRHTDPDSFDEGVDQAYVALCREALAARLPVFKEAPMRGGSAGMIMMSPDGRPIIDQIPSVSGLFAMLGLRHLLPTRFTDGRPWHDPDHYGTERLTISR